MVERLSWSMTAITYFGEMLVASVLAIVLLAISPLETRYAGMLFAGGAVAWTLSEYVVHRFVLHNLTPTQHALHHANPDEPVLTVFWQIWACFALVYSIAGGPFLAGALIAYAGICLCITVLTAVQAICLYPYLSITEATTDSRLETTVSAQRFGIMYSGRCSDNYLAL
jgi:hypothetical protein